MANKKKVVVVGNCQARPITTLLEAMSDEVEVTKVAIVHLLNDDQESAYKPFFEEADYIIAQLVASNYPCKFVRTDLLEQSYGHKLVKIVNLFCYADTPYLRNLPKSLRGAEPPFGDYHFPSVYECWENGKDINTAVLELNKQSNNLTKQAESYEELAAREKLADVAIVDYIKNAKHRLFHTFNHPRNDLLLEYTKRILKHLKLNELPLDEKPAGAFLGQFVPFIKGGENPEHKLVKDKKVILKTTHQLVKDFYVFYEKNMDKQGEVVIPKVIIQYWNDKVIPKDIESLINSWKDNNPKYIHKLFDRDTAAEFLELNYNKQIKNLFLSFTIPAMQSDFFRLAYIFKFGGVYVDAASKCISSLDTIISASHTKTILMRKWHGKVCNGFIASTKNDLFIKHIWERVNENLCDRSIVDTKDVWTITGPKVYIDALNGELKKFVTLIDQAEFSGVFSWVNDLQHKKNNHWSLAQKKSNLFLSKNLIDKEIIVHIGQHKTGSTAIQRCAMLHKGNDFIYPDTGRLYSGHHDLPKICQDLSDDEFDIFSKKFITEVNEHSSNYVLISSEFLSSNSELVFDEKSMLKIWSRLSKVISLFAKSTVTFYVREQSLAIESRINQSIKSRICNSSVNIEGFFANKSLMYSEFYDLVNNTFINSKIVPIAYERSLFYKNDICCDFFKRFFNIELEYGTSSNPKIDNLEYLLLCMKVNALDADVDTKMSLKNAIKSNFNSNENTVNNTILTKKQVKFILDYYKADNEMFVNKSNYFQGFNKYMQSNRDIEISELLKSNSDFYRFIADLLSKK